MSDFDLTKTKPDDLIARQKVTKKHLTLDDLKKSTQSLQTKSIKRAICMDTSGSMAGYKITEVRRMFKELYHPHIDSITFNNDVYLLDKEDFSKLDAVGGTCMLKTLNELWANSYAHIILGTDGEPTDSGEEQILIVAAQHATIPIDTIGIGNKGGGGYNPDFLRELARITGGRFTDCGEPIQLTSIVENLLLNPPSGMQLNDGKTNKGGVIQL